MATSSPINRPFRKPAAGNLVSGGVSPGARSAPTDSVPGQPAHASRPVAHSEEPDKPERADSLTQVEFHKSQFELLRKFARRMD
jgi:hypothetical protein